MRQFEDIIFFGCETCAEKTKLLHKRLDEAFYIMSGIQQPIHATSEKQYKELEIEYKRNRQELKDIVQDIVTALLGKEK